jgi:hypothetical protein
MVFEDKPSPTLQNKNAFAIQKLLEKTAMFVNVHKSLTLSLTNDFKYSCRSIDL